MSDDPPVGLGLGQPPQALAVLPQIPGHGLRSDPLAKQDLTSGDDRQLGLADLVVGSGLGATGSLTDDEQEVERDAARLADLPERRLRERVESVVGWLLHEVEGQEATAHGLCQAVERKAGLLERLDEADTTDIGIG